MTDPAIATIQNQVSTLQYQMSGVTVGASHLTYDGVTITVDSPLKTPSITNTGDMNTSTLTVSGGTTGTYSFTNSRDLDNSHGQVVAQTLWTNSLVVALGGSVICGSVNAIVGPGTGDVSCHTLHTDGIAVTGDTTTGGLIINGSFSASGTAHLGGVAVPSGDVQCHTLHADGIAVSGDSSIQGLTIAGSFSAGGTAHLGGVAVPAGDVQCHTLHADGGAVTGAFTCSNFNTNQTTPGIPGAPSTSTPFTSPTGTGVLTGAGDGWCVAVIAALNAINNRLHALGIFT